jgi:hypothetical protein
MGDFEPDGKNLQQNCTFRLLAVLGSRKDQTIRAYTP